MLDMNKTVLLITGCIRSNPNTFQLSLTNVNLRLKQYLDCVKWNIESTKFVNTVFADNSGYPIDNGLIEFANKRAKRLEWLSFTGNEKMIARAMEKVKL